MKETLKIKNFGTIKDMELDLRRINVFIGDQGTGKSTVSKLICICRYFSYISNNFYSNHKSFEDGLFIWGMDEYIKEDTYIKYSNKHYTFNIDFSKDISDYKELKSNSKEFSSLLKTYNDWHPNPEEHGYVKLDIEKIPDSFFLNDVSKILDNPFFIPVERGLQSIFSLGKTSLNNLSDSLFNQFSKIDNIARTFKSDTFIEPLKITYKNENGFGKFKTTEQDSFYPMTSAASGYQALIPIALICKFYEKNLKSKTIIIEEPELNLFPETQYNLIKYFSRYYKINKNQFFITTHSPYILSSINNLMYAYNMGLIDAEKTNKIIPKEFWLNSEDVSCYSFEEGNAFEILDRAEGLINTGKIDSVSKIMGEEFDQLLGIDVEYNNHGED